MELSRQGLKYVNIRLPLCGSVSSHDQCSISVHRDHLGSIEHCTIDILRMLQQELYNLLMHFWLVPVVAACLYVMLVTCWRDLRSRLIGLNELQHNINHLLRLCTESRSQQRMQLVGALQAHRAPQTIEYTHHGRVTPGNCSRAFGGSPSIWRQNATYRGQYCTRLQQIELRMPVWIQLTWNQQGIPCGAEMYWDYGQPERIHSFASGANAAGHDSNARIGS